MGRIEDNFIICVRISFSGKKHSKSFTRTYYLIYSKPLIFLSSSLSFRGHVYGRYLQITTVFHLSTDNGTDIAKHNEVNVFEDDGGLLHLV